MYIIQNGLRIESEKASIMVASEGYNFGYGIFETIKVVEGKILFFEEHLQRLQSGCKKLSLSTSFSSDELRKHCNDLIDANEMLSGVIKILFGKSKDNTDIIISTRQNSYKKENYDRGFRICFAEAKRNPYAMLTYIKSANYLENLLEKQKAAKRGFDEAVFLNIYEKISEGSLSNIFFIKDSVLCTPSISCGLLPGILREKVLALGKELGMQLSLGEFSMEELIAADEIFITNSILEIMPVSQIENQKLDIGKNKITSMLSKTYLEMIEKACKI